MKEKSDAKEMKEKRDTFRNIQKLKIRLMATTRPEARAIIEEAIRGEYKRLALRTGRIVKATRGALIETAAYESPAEAR